MQVKLLPYKRKNIISAQELTQKIGWGVNLAHLPQVWAKAKTQGEGVVIAVLDTGVDLTHPDLVDNLLPGVNIIDPSKPPIDTGGHGTHTTGIICASNNDLGIVGVAPKAKVRPVKILDEDGNGSIEDVIKGINWAIDQKVDFISMSLGSPKPFAGLRRAIKRANKQGIVIFCAAGNMGESDHLLYPANYPETISVGAISADCKRWTNSNTGKGLSFVAPGVEILSCVNKDWYAIMSGSSMAAPFVCGLAALLLSYKRNHGLNVKLDTTEDYVNYFKLHTIDIINGAYSGQKKYQGYGIITPEKFFEMNQEV